MNVSLNLILQRIHALHLALRLRGLEVSQERVAELTSALEEKLKVYGKILGKQKYLAGNVCSVVVSKTILLLTRI